MNTLTIENAQAEDFAEIAEIYNKYIILGNSTMEETLYDSEKIAQWHAHLGECERLLVLKQYNSIIGWGIIKKYSPREGYRYACETSTYLKSSEIGKGYGTFLKKHLMSICRDLGYHHIVAKIFATNKASIAYNIKLGYEIVGIQKEIGFKNGKWVDMIIMQYLISAID